MREPRDEAQPALGQWIKRRRRALGLTQDALAERLAYASPTIQKVERGERRPSQALAERLAEVLELRADEREQFLRLARSAPPLAEPPAAAPTRRPRLRPAAPHTPLIGRAAECAAVQERLRVPGVRLVTLLGPGGVGKTSLAQALAAQAADDADTFPDGSAVALLAPITAVANLAGTIAEAVGADLAASHDPADQLLAALAGRELLLVLDNLEQLLSPDNYEQTAALLRRIIGEAPGVRMLATSRERLRLRDEWVVELGGLTLPDRDDPRRLTQAPAVQLFLERARQVAPAFAPDAEQLIAASRICRRLEGMPLAIELAASWCRALTASEIAAEIDRALDFLAGEERDAEARHLSLRAALDHSWRLLTLREQQLLARLSVFRGGWDREAAAHVAQASLTSLTRLIDKSLVRREAAGSVTRYTLHELVRQYAAERLAADPETRQAAEALHTAYYSRLLQGAIDPSGSIAPQALARVSREIDNLRAAWDRAVEAESEDLVVMARGLTLLCESNSWMADGVELFGRAAGALRANGASPALTGLMLGYQGYYLSRAGAFLAARPLLEAGLACIEAAGVEPWLPTVALNLGITEYRMGRLDAAEACLTRSADLARAHDPFALAWAECHLGTLALDRGDTRAAELHLTRFAQAWQGQEYTIGAGVSMVALAALDLAVGRPAEALARARAAMRWAAEARDRFVIGLCLLALASLAAGQGDLDEAGYLLSESAEVMRGIGDWWFLGDVLAQRLQLAATIGDSRHARALGAELVGMARQGAALLIPEICSGLALMLHHEGAAGQALTLLQVVDELPARHGTRTRAAQLRARIEGEPATNAPAAGVPRGQALLAWLEMLCAQMPEPPPERANGAERTPALPAGWLRIPETGEVLSPRELEVLRLLVAGASNKDVADTLVISLHTVKRHVTNILQKFNASSRLDAVARARAAGLDG